MQRKGSNGTSPKYKPAEMAESAEIAEKYRNTEPRIFTDAETDEHGKYKYSRI
jgi:hypothetical protein